MRVLIPVLEPVHKKRDITAIVLDIDMNYDSNTPYNKHSTEILRQTLLWYHLELWDYIYGI